MFTYNISDLSIFEIRQDLDVQDQPLQRYSVDLRYGLRQHVVPEPMAGVEVHAHARHYPTGTTLPLECVRSRHPHRLQAFHVAVGIEVRLLHLARVDDEDTVVDGDGRFREVRRQDNFPLAGFRPP